MKRIWLSTGMWRASWQKSHCFQAQKLPDHLQEGGVAQLMIRDNHWDFRFSYCSHCGHCQSFKLTALRQDQSQDSQPETWCDSSRYLCTTFSRFFPWCNQPLTSTILRMVFVPLGCVPYLPDPCISAEHLKHCLTSLYGQPHIFIDHNGRHLAPVKTQVTIDTWNQVSKFVSETYL